MPANMSVDSDDSVWWEAHYAYGKIFLAGEVFHIESMQSMQLGNEFEKEASVRAV